MEKEADTPNKGETPPTWTRRRTIGPDAWYNDDFNFDKAQPAFSDDPVLNEQYGQLLDIQYRAIHGPPRRKSEGNSNVSSRPRRLLKDEGRSVTWHSDRFKEVMSNRATQKETPPKNLVQDRLKRFQPEKKEETEKKKDSLN